MSWRKNKRVLAKRKTARGMGIAMLAGLIMQNPSASFRSLAKEGRRGCFLFSKAEIDRFGRNFRQRTRFDSETQERSKILQPPLNRWLDQAISGHILCGRPLKRASMDGRSRCCAKAFSLACSAHNDTHSKAQETPWSVRSLANPANAKIPAVQIESAGIFVSFVRFNGKFLSLTSV